MKRRLIPILVLVLSAVSGIVHAGLGDLDQPNGLKVTGFKDRQKGYAIVQLADGRTLMAGVTGAREILLMRRDANGNVDPTFGDQGIWKAFNYVRSIAGIAVTVDNKILVAGTFGSTQTYFFVARFYYNGGLDGGFPEGGGQPGVAIADFGSQAVANDMLVQPDGKIVVVGSAGNQVGIARFFSTGAPDTGFSGDGKVESSFIGTASARGVGIQADGKIVIAGRFFASLFSDTEFLAMRFTTTGVPDTGFGGGDGYVTTDFFGENDAAEAAMVQADGKIALAGTVNDGTEDMVGMLRYDSTGVLDPAFNGTGKFTYTTANRSQKITCAKLRSDGKFVLGGNEIGGNDDPIGVIVNSNGTLNSYVAYGAGVVLNLALFSDNSYEEVGYHPIEPYHFIRTNRFSSTNVYQLGLPYLECCGSDGFRDAFLQGNGKVLAVAYAGDQFEVVRFNADGSLDDDFQVNGRYVSSQSTPISAVAIRPAAEGKFVVGASGSQLNRQYLYYFNPDGSLYTNFNGTGILTISSFSDSNDMYDLLIQTDGKIVTAGNYSNGVIFNLFVKRYNMDGTPDLSFDNDGSLEVSLGGDVYEIRVTQLPSGQLLVAGTYFSNGGRTFLFRLNSNGTLDGSFGGIKFLDFTTDDILGALTKYGNSFFVVGTSFESPNFYTFIAKFLADGSLDPSFGSTSPGVTRILSSPLPLNVTGIAIQPNGKILLSGTNASQDDMLVLRFRANGAPDTEFGTNGALTFDSGQGLQDYGVRIFFLPGYKARIYGGQFNLYGGEFDHNIFSAQFMASMLFEDFNDAVLNWVPVKPSWVEIGGNLVGTPTRKAIIVAPPSFPGCSKCQVEAVMKTAGGIGNKLSLLGWYVNKGNSVELLMKEENDKFILKQRVNGSVVASAKGLLPISPNQDQLVRIIFDGTQFKVYVNTQLIITMNKAPGSSPSGTVAFQVKGTTGTFGQVVIDSP